MSPSLLAACYLVSLPVVVIGIVDLARIPNHIYEFTPYSRWVWIGVILGGYLCVGVGGIMLTVAWFRSTERVELRDDMTLDRRWDHPVMTGHRTRIDRRRERQRRQRWAMAAVSLPVVLAIAFVAVVRV
ncbi:MAG TPA: hypothetical protein VGN59_10730 [Acidimicrobiia bacterium]